MPIQIKIRVVFGFKSKLLVVWFNYLMLCLDFSMNIVSVVGCKLGSSSQSSGSRSDICCRFPILSSLLPAVTCSKDQFRSDISYRYLILSSLLPTVTWSKDQI